MARGYLRRIGQAEASGWFFFRTLQRRSRLRVCCAGSLLFVVLGATAGVAGDAVC